MANQSFFRRVGWLLIILVILLILAAAIYFLSGRFSFQRAQSISPSAISQPLDDLPVLADKPQPYAVPFNGCPPQGQGGDVELNLLKNRVDEGNYVSVTIDSLLALRWPKNIELQAMNTWSPQSDAYISQYEGMPVVIEGYFGTAKEAPPDPANCSRNNIENVDWNVTLLNQPGDDNLQSVLTLITPRVRATHNKWTLEAIRSISYEQELVRVSGWLLFDPEHPNDIGATRATLWEVDPVIQIEVLHDGRWVLLDKLGNQ